MAVDVPHAEDHDLGSSLREHPPPVGEGLDAFEPLGRGGESFGRLVGRGDEFGSGQVDEEFVDGVSPIAAARAADHRGLERRVR